MNAPVAVGFSYSVLDKIAEDLQIPPMRQDVSLKPLEGKMLIRKILGAAGDSSTNSDKMKEMSDPYLGDTRKAFATAALEDPALSPALEKRNTAFFKNGFRLDLQLKSLRSKNGTQLTPDQADAALKKERARYDKYIQMLEDWSEEDNIKVLDKMRASNIASIDQGRSLTLIFPAISSLVGEELPQSLKTISYEDIGNPIINTDFWSIVAVRLNNLGKKSVALPEEMVYIPRKDWALRKDSAYYGASAIEPVLQVSKIYRKVVNYDLAKAAVAGYITRLMLEVPVDGLTEAQKKAAITAILSDLMAQGTDIVGVEAGTKATAVPVKVDTEMIRMVIDKLENHLISAGGSTKSQMGRTEDLNYANATVQELAFIKYVRDPDEELIKTAFENQLFNPLLAKLAGKEFKEIPVRVVIVREEPVDANKNLIPDQLEGTVATDQAISNTQTTAGGKQGNINSAESQKNTDQQAMSKGKPTAKGSKAPE